MHLYISVVIRSAHKLIKQCCKMKLYVQFSVSVPVCCLLPHVCFLSVNSWI